MTFLLAFWKPIAGIVGVLILLVGLLALKHSYDEGKRDEGRAEIQAKFDAYVQESTKQVAAVTAKWDQQRQAAETAAEGLANERSKRAAEAQIRVRALPHAVAAVVVAPAAVDILRDAIDASNQPTTTRPADQPVEARPTAAADPDDGATTVGRLSEWALQVISQYSECRDQVHGWIAFYTGLQAAQPREQSP